jgi:HTH-type transcriptional regulator/antitoxin MqsA
MNALELCPICGEGHVTAQTENVEHEYKGTKGMVPIHFLLCDHCSSDFAGAAEAKLNKRALMAWRKQIDGLLTGEEIAALRAQYKLTQGQAAKLFGGGPVAFSKYENDDVAQSEAMDTLLRLVRRSAAVFWALVEEKKMTDEFVQERPVIAQTHTTAVVKVVRLAANGSTSSEDVRYDPRSLRRTEGKAADPWRK